MLLGNRAVSGRTRFALNTSEPQLMGKPGRSGKCSSEGGSGKAREMLAGLAAAGL